MNNRRQDAAGTRRQDACATAAEAVQSLGNQGPSRLVRLCQTIFYKKIMKLSGWISIICNDFQRFASNEF